MIRSGGFKRVNKKERSIGRLYIQTKKKRIYNREEIDCTHQQKEEYTFIIRRT